MIVVFIWIFLIYFQFHRSQLRRILLWTIFAPVLNSLNYFGHVWCLSLCWVRRNFAQSFCDHFHIIVRNQVDCAHVRIVFLIRHLINLEKTVVWWSLALENFLAITAPIRSIGQNILRVSFVPHHLFLCFYKILII